MLRRNNVLTRSPILRFDKRTLFEALGNCRPPTTYKILVAEDFRRLTCTSLSALWKFGKLAIVEDQKRIVGPASNEPFLWRVNAVIGQLEGSVVDGDAGLGAENILGFNGFFGTHMYR